LNGSSQHFCYPSKKNIYITSSFIREKKNFLERERNQEYFFFVFKTFLGIFGEQEKKYDNLK
jgi:hypothetical protein